MHVVSGAATDQGLDGLSQPKQPNTLGAASPLICASFAGSWLNHCHIMWLTFQCLAVRVEVFLSELIASVGQCI